MAPPREIAGSGAPPGWLARIGAYVELTKPRIVELLLTTTVPAMVVAAGRWPRTWLVIATLIGGTLSAGGANAINNYVDRDIDRLMRRTRRRPLPTARVAPLRSLVFGAGLGLLGFLWLWWQANLLAGLLATAGLLFYVFGYTLYLKRMTTQNIVIGGAAGAVPVLVGWAAVTDTLAVPAWILFAIVFFWTPPHFWALSVRYKEDYSAAGVPMLPVVAGDRMTLDHIVVYTVVLAGISLLLYPAVPMGWIYLAAAGGLGGFLLVEAGRLRRNPGRAMVFFGYSNGYLAALFLAIALDRIVL
jgi:protoheme IX farnesyltransferase